MKTIISWRPTVVLNHAEILQERGTRGFLEASRWQPSNKAMTMTMDDGNFQTTVHLLDWSSKCMQDSIQGEFFAACSILSINSSYPIAFQLDFLTFHPLGTCNNRPTPTQSSVFLLEGYCQPQTCPQSESVCVAPSFLSPGRLSGSRDIKAISVVWWWVLCLPRAGFHAVSHQTRCPSGTDGGGRVGNAGEQWGEIKQQLRIHSLDRGSGSRDWVGGVLLCCVCVSLLAEIS